MNLHKTKQNRAKLRAKRKTRAAKVCNHKYANGSSALTFAAGMTLCHKCGWNDWIY